MRSVSVKAITSLPETTRKASVPLPHEFLFRLRPQLRLALRAAPSEVTVWNSVCPKNASHLLWPLPVLLQEYG
jgi:hypothetical protein